MSSAKKFMFDLAFDNEVDLSPEPETNVENIIEEQEPEIIVPTFSEEEVEKARQQGYESGKEEGLAATTEVLTKQISETLIKIDEKLKAAFQNQDSLNLELSRAAHSLAVGVCKKILPSMAERNSFDEVEKVIEEVFAKAIESAQITITVHVDIVEAVKIRLTELAEDSKFKGRIQVKAGDTMAASDCIIDWVDGGAERNSKKLWADITSILNRNIGEKPTIWDNPSENEYNQADKTDVITEPEEPIHSVENNFQVEASQKEEKGVNNDTDEFVEKQPVDQSQQTNIDD